MTTIAGWADVLTAPLGPLPLAPDHSRTTTTAAWSGKDAGDLLVGEVIWRHDPTIVERLLSSLERGLRARGLFGQPFSPALVQEVQVRLCDAIDLEMKDERTVSLSATHLNSAVAALVRLLYAAHNRHVVVRPDPPAMRHSQQGDMDLLVREDGNMQGGVGEETKWQAVLSKKRSSLQIWEGRIATTRGKVTDFKAMIVKIFLQLLVRDLRFGIFYGGYTFIAVERCVLSDGRPCVLISDMHRTTGNVPIPVIAGQDAPDTQARSIVGVLVAMLAAGLDDFAVTAPAAAMLVAATMPGMDSIAEIQEEPINPAAVDEEQDDGNAGDAGAGLGSWSSMQGADLSSLLPGWSLVMTDSVVTITALGDKMLDVRFSCDAARHLQSQSFRHVGFMFTSQQEPHQAHSTPRSPAVCDPLDVVDDPFRPIEASPPPSPAASPVFDGPAGSDTSFSTQTSASSDNATKPVHDQLRLHDRIGFGSTSSVRRATFTGEDGSSRLGVWKAVGFRHLSTVLRETFVYLAMQARDPARKLPIARHLGTYAMLPGSVYGILLSDAGGRHIANELGVGWEVLDRDEDPEVIKGTVYEALKALHRVGVYHNDFEPRNVLRLGPSQVQVIDFGRAELHKCLGEVSCPELVDVREELFGD